MAGISQLGRATQREVSSTSGWSYEDDTGVRRPPTSCEVSDEDASRFHGNSLGKGMGRRGLCECSAHSPLYSNPREKPPKAEDGNMAE